MSFEVPAACTLPTAARPLRLAETGDGVVLDIEVPAAHAAILDGLSALATSAAPAAAP